MAPSLPQPRLALYNYWRSSCSWRVRIGLHLKGLAFDYRTVNLIEGAHQTEADGSQTDAAACGGEEESAGHGDLWCAGYR